MKTLTPHPIYNGFDSTGPAPTYTTTGTGVLSVESVSDTSSGAPIQYVTDATSGTPTPDGGLVLPVTYVPLGATGASPDLVRALQPSGSYGSPRYEKPSDRVAEIRGIGELLELSDDGGNWVFSTLPGNSRVDALLTKYVDGIPVNGALVEFKNKTAKDPDCRSGPDERKPKNGKPFVNKFKVDKVLTVSDQFLVAFVCVWMYADAFIVGHFHNGCVRNAGLIDRADPGPFARRDRRASNVYSVDWDDTDPKERQR